MNIAWKLRFAALSAAIVAALLTGLATPAFAQNNAVQFDGTNDYITFGADTVKLGLSKFTIELWLYRTGAGATASTGTGGVTAVPLFTKGRGEADGDKRDMNYFFGIRGTDNVLCADYEEGTGQTSPGLNHPVAGATPIRNNTWYHAAASFDGTTWRLYLNGVLDAELVVGASRLPQDQSIQHAGLGAALTSTGVAAGFFLGTIDEARIWDRALTQQEIIDNMTLELASGTGLNGRWGLNEGTGTTAANSIAGSPNGTLTNGPTWVPGSPFTLANALRLGASSAYVTFRNPAELGLATFTLETWFRRDGAGTAVSTGTGGITALPLVTHGAAQAEGGNLDMNWFLGIRSSDNVICADFEESTTGATPGLNHPIAGVTPIVTGQWYHAAATYDGATWKLYLNGVLESELSVGQPPEFATLQHAGLGTTLRSDSTANGFFNGALDEVRVWNHARTAAEIETEINSRISTTRTGLVARWSLDEGAGSIVRSTAGVTLPGSIKGTGSSWDAPAPFNIVVSHDPPAAPTGLAATALAPTQIRIDWTDNSNNEAAFIIERSASGSGGPFAVYDSAAANAVQYTDAGCAQNTEYCYQVRARNAYGYSGYAGPACATTPQELPPAAPTALTATAVSYAQIDLAWTDNSSNETGFAIERSVYGAGGPFAPLAVVSANAVSYTDDYLEGGQEYCYRVRAAGNAGPSGWTDVSCATTPVEVPYALDFGASNGCVTFGNPAQLGLPQFTIETWFKREGVGATANTGSGGFYAIPLVTKGVGEADNSNVDMNYFLGIRGTDSVLVADFEATPGGQNYPVVGMTPIHTGEWHHAAATYDGSKWRLYLDGVLETETTVNATPQWQSIQHAGLGVALNSTGTASGHFDGVLDEARIWNYARSAAQIQSTVNEQIVSAQIGLVARWALNEGASARIHGSANTAVTGTIVNTGWAWVGPAPFDLEINNAPYDPALVSPFDGATGVALTPTLEVTASDPESDTLTVTFYGRAIDTTAAGAPFSIILIPDTQYYTSEMNGGLTAHFQQQTMWAATRRDSLNLVYVHHIGDFTENGDTYHVQWENGWLAMQTLEDTSITHLPEGIPYGVTVGNHDQTPAGDATGTTNGYNEYYGADHFAGRSYYGGHFGANNDAHFDLFGASGIDFIVISMEHDTAPDAAVLAWADSLLKAHPTRRGLIMVHNLTGTGNPASFSAQGTAVYDALKDNSNLLLMFAGHAAGEGRRSDTYLGNTVHTLMADYQSRANGGDGWLRIYKFYPAENVVRARTYSPKLNTFEADADSSSQFTLSVDLAPLAEWQQIATVTGVVSGSSVQVAWPGLSPIAGYEWYVTVSDGNSTTTGPVGSFTTRSAAPTATVVAPNGGEEIDAGAQTTIQWTAGDDVAVASVDLLISRNGENGDYAPIATGLANTGTFEWTIEGPSTTAAYIMVVAYDAEGQTASDASDTSFAIIATTDVEDWRVPKLSFEIASAHPMNGAGSFSLALPKSSHVNVSVFDVTGRRIAVLANGAYVAGRHRIAWTGMTDRGKAASGIYFVKLNTMGTSLTRKIVLMR